MNALLSRSYKFSHTAPAKGAEYERLYETNVWQGYLWRREQAALSEALQNELAGKPVDLLDFACGTGRVTAFLENQVRSATGVDVSESMLAVARRKLTRSRILLADITESPVLEGQQFNLITAFRFFTNAEPALRKKVMRTLANSLTDDGLLVFNNHQNAWAPYPLAALLRHRSNRKADNIYRVMSPWAMQRLCRDAGLKIVRVHGLGLLHLPKYRPSFRRNEVAERWSRHVPLISWLASDLVAICRKRRQA
jgi:SAM-dependent methyltransferase